MYNSSGSGTPHNPEDPLASRVYQHPHSLSALSVVDTCTARASSCPPIGHHHENGPMLRVLEFNVHPKRINDPTGMSLQCESPLVSYTIKDGPSTVPRGRVFVHDIVTSLPYMESSRAGSFNYSGFLIDDERIIGMKVRDCPLSFIPCMSEN